MGLSRFYEFETKGEFGPLLLHILRASKEDFLELEIDPIKVGPPPIFLINGLRIAYNIIGLLAGP